MSALPDIAKQYFSPPITQYTSQKRYEILMSHNTYHLLDMSVYCTTFQLSKKKGKKEEKKKIDYFH